MKVILLGLMILAVFLVPAYGQVTYFPPTDQVQAAPAGDAQDAETQFPIARTIGGLGLVVCVMIGAYFAARKFAPRYFTKAGSDRNLKVIETLAMGDRRSISLIEVANNRFLVGNTPHQINLLAALPEPVSLLSEPETMPVNQKEIKREESRSPFRNLFEVEKKRPARYIGHPLPEDIRTKMRQLREALER